MNASGVRPPDSALTASGNSFTCRSVTLLWRTTVSAWITGGSEVTLTVSPMAPASSLTSSVRVTCTATCILSMVVVLKP